MLNRVGRKSMTVFNMVFLSAFFLCALSVAFLPAKTKFNLFTPTMPILVCALAIIAVFFYLADRAKIPARATKFEPYILATIFAVFLGVQVVIARALASTGYTWDNQIVFNAATQYALHGRIAAQGVKYFVINPNNIPLFTVLGAYFRLLHHFHISYFVTYGAMLNAVLMWLTQVMIYLVARYFYGRKIASLSLIFSFALIDLSIQVATVYTDTFAIIFPITLLYLTLRLIKAKAAKSRIALSACLGVVAVIGTLMKPSVAVAAIAIGVTGLIWFAAVTSRRSLKARVGVMCACLTAVLLMMLVTYLTYLKTVDSLHLLPFSAATAADNGTPPSHFVAIGMETHAYSNRTEYGDYDPVQAQAMANLSTEAQRNTYSYSSIERTLESYGPIGYLNFLGHKANWITSDATFYAYGEGSNQNVSFAHHDTTSTFVREFMYVSGKYYVLFANILQVFWLAVLLLIAMQLFFVVLNKASRTNIYLTMMRLMIAGIIVFLLIFEGRSRYLFLYLPIFILLSLYTVKVFDNRQS